MGSVDSVVSDDELGVSDVEEPETHTNLEAQKKKRHAEHRTAFDT